MSKQVRFEASGNIQHELKVDEPNSNELSGNEDSPIDNNEKRQFNKFELLDLVEGDGEISAESAGYSGDETSSDIEHSGKDEKVASKNKGTKSSSKQKPRKRRGKKKSSKSSKSDTDQDKELTSLANAINQRNELPEQSQADNSRYKLLKVDMRNLIPETEIKKIFGKGVVKEDKLRIKHHPGTNLQRSRFVSSGYVDTKSTSSLAGPKMELDDLINDMQVGYTTGGGRINPGTTLFNSPSPIYFKIVHDAAYQQVHRMFLDAVHRGHSQFIVENLQSMPTHVESLLQLSHMIRVSEDYKTASEFIERALVVFERGFHPRFNLATATCRLTYKRPENRTFFITIFKHINACHRRGLRRTPFEYSKLLLSLEPDNDPLMAVQLLDFFAIRCEEYDYLIDFHSQWEQLQKLPNLCFSLAMAHYLKSRNTKRSRAENDASLKLADECLQRALLLFPNFIVPLLDACSGEPDAELKKCNYFDYSVYSTKYKLVPETVDVLVSLYVKRTFSLWKQKNLLAWLERNVADIVGRFARGDLVDEGRHIQHWSTFTKVAPKNLLRHIVSSDLDMKVPSSASSSTYIDIDPYPPKDSIVTYDTSLSANVRATPGGGGSLFVGVSSLFFRSILPSFSLSDQNSSVQSTAQTQRVTSANRTNGSQRNRPPQRPIGATVARLPRDERALNDVGDLDPIEYSLLIDALRDLPPLGPDSTQETQHQTNNQIDQQQRNRPSDADESDSGHRGN